MKEAIAAVNAANEAVRTGYLSVNLVLTHFQGDKRKAEDGDDGEPVKKKKKKKKKAAEEASEEMETETVSHFLFQNSL